jgi:membrane protein DedA with SNARE-associated domain
MDSLFLSHGSYFAITIVLILTGLGLPIPEEVAIIAAGVLASQGQLNPYLALLSCMVGVLIGDLVIYGIGHRFGRNVVREHPYWASLVNAQREARVEQMIRRHGAKVLFVARFLVGLRAAVYLTAGILRMPLARFLLIDLCCASVVVSSFYLLSFHFGQEILFWIRRAEILITVVVVLVLFSVGLVFWRSYRAHLSGAASARGCDDSSSEDKSDAKRVDQAEHVV